MPPKAPRTSANGDTPAAYAADVEVGVEAPAPEAGPAAPNTVNINTPCTHYQYTIIMKAFAVLCVVSLIGLFIIMNEAYTCNK